MAVDGTHQLVIEEQGGVSLGVLLELVPAEGVHIDDIWGVLRLCVLFVNILHRKEIYMWVCENRKMSLYISRILFGM